MKRAAIFLTLACAAAPRLAIAGPDAPAAPVGAEPPDGRTPSPIDETIGFEVSGYIDDDSTEVLTPSAKFGIENELAGWGVDASFLVDVVTAASTDIVATASPKWTDVRYEPDVAAHFKVGQTTLHLGGGASVESDYIGANADLGFAVDLRQKTITPSFDYAFGYDIAGRRGTPYSVYEKVLHTHTFQGAIDVVLDKATILVPTAMVSLEFGDSAKPYRYVPTFAPGTQIDAGASIDEVNAARTGVRLEERVPQTRQRYAVSALLAHRFTTVTLRVDERLYADSWGLMASTTDVMLPIDVGSHFRLWPHVRAHAQKGVDFWERAYTVTDTPMGVSVPGLRAGDRELGPLVGVTGGVGFRAGTDAIGFGITADAIYTRFLDHLYLAHRLAGFGTTTFEARF